MPQTSAYLSDENDSLGSDDTQRVDDSKPETWSLFLPSAVPTGERSLCYKGVVETERVLRLAQLEDSLVDLRQLRRALRNLRLYFKTNTAGEGRKTQTKSRTIETGVNNRIRRAVCRYRIAYRALLELDAAGDWTKEYRELRDEDNWGPLKEIDEGGPGDGRYAPSWIWTSSSAMELPGEGSTAEKREVSETIRHEWMTCRARADRWMEEEELLREEMRRVIVYLEWKSHMWSGKVGIRAGSCTPDVQNGVDAYARKQADIHRGLAISFGGQWLPYLKAYGFETEWAEAFPWLSQFISSEAKLPKRYAPTPAEVPPTHSSAGAPPGTTERSGTEEKRPDTCEDGKHGERADSNNEGSGDSEQDSGSENEDSDGEGCDDEDDGDEDDGDEEQYSGDVDEGYGDGTEADDGFGFEYDDDYMS
jgi:hypothetical protein